MKVKNILIFGALFGFTAIVLGAFGAHGLKTQITAEQLTSFETGVRFQMYHALGLLLLGIASGHLSAFTQKWVSVLWVLGVLLFSGSIYGLATNDLTAFNFKVIAWITPIGGTLLIVGWGWLLVNFLTQKAH